MPEKIDCLLIGHNESDFNDYAESVRALGEDSSVYRDLKLNFIWHQGIRHTVTDILNCYAPESHHFHMGEVFSTTIAYLGSYLARHGYVSDYVNDFYNEKAILKKKLLTDDILTIGITTTLYTNHYPITEICRFIRKYNQDVKIIIGGPFVLNLYHASQDLTNVFNFFKIVNADVLVNSAQGESTLVRVINAYKTGLDFESIANIIYSKNGKPVSNTLEMENNRLDNNLINWPYFKSKLGKFVSVRTCLSCPFNCYFCGFRERAGKHKVARVETVERELDMLEAIGTIKSINFIDDTFNMPPKRFKNILRMMIRKNYSFKWNCYFRCQFADEEMVELMEDSGCEGVYLGIESANQTVLDNMRKNVSVNQYRRGISLLKKTNMLIHTNFLVGFVGETAATLKDTTNFIKDYQPDFYRMQLWYLDRVTPIWRDRDLFNIKGSSFMWSHDTMNSEEACDHIDRIITNEISHSVWVPVHNFNLHNLYRLKHKGMDIDDIKRFLNSFFEGIKEGILYPRKKDISKQTLEMMKTSLNSEIIVTI